MHLSCAVWVGGHQHCPSTGAWSGGAGTAHGPVDCRVWVANRKRLLNCEDSEEPPTGTPLSLWGLWAVRTGGTLRNLTIAEQNEECGHSNDQGLCLQHGDLPQHVPKASGRRDLEGRGPMGVLEGRGRVYLHGDTS